MTTDQVVRPRRAALSHEDVAAAMRVPAADVQRRARERGLDDGPLGLAQLAQLLADDSRAATRRVAATPLPARAARSCDARTVPTPCTRP
jgi:hypothetical protein